MYGAGDVDCSDPQYIAQPARRRPGSDIRCSEETEPGCAFHCGVTLPGRRGARPARSRKNSLGELADYMTAIGASWSIGVSGLAEATLGDVTVTSFRFSEQANVDQSARELLQVAKAAWGEL